MNFIKNRMEYRRLCLRPCGFIQKARKEERRTAETIRIEIPIEVDDNTGPGTSSVEKNMNKVKDAADKVKSSTDQMSTSAKKANDEVTKFDRSAQKTQKSLLSWAKEKYSVLLEAKDKISPIL